jgi:hypothetical protein
VKGNLRRENTDNQVDWGLARLGMFVWGWVIIRVGECFGKSLLLIKYLL